MEHKWKKFLSYYKPYMGMFFIDMICALLTAVTALVSPLVIRYITNTVVYEEVGNATRDIIRMSLILVGLVAVELVCRYIVTSIGHVMGTHMETDMRSEIFEHYQKLSFSFYDEQKVGALMSRISNDLFEICELFHHGPEDIIISFIKLIGSFIILLSINPVLALAAFLLIPVMTAYAYYYNRKLKRAYKENKIRIAGINAQTEDSLSGIRVVKSFANEELEKKKFEVGNASYLKSKSYSYRIMALYHSGLGAFTNLINVCVIGVGGFLLSKGKLDVTDLVTFFLYIGTFTEPVKKLIDFTEQFQNGAAGYERFLEIINREPDIKDKKNALEVKKLKGSIDFKDVTFHYSSSEQDVIKNLNLHIKEGSYTAIVGTSGGGKTTLLSLIPRFYDTTSGKVLIDGIDVRDMKLKSLRENIGIVQQDVYLFAGTIMENIRYGKVSATDEEVYEAAKKANAHDFIMDFQDGYNTDIGQRGVKLSGGQKQRISIARVFLKDPPILLFDEATSALDNESERIVQESMEALSGGRTTLVIAHRLSTVRGAERIIVLDEEGIKEEGTHDELIKKGGAYAKLYKTYEL